MTKPTLESLMHSESYDHAVTLIKTSDQTFLNKLSSVASLQLIN